MKGQNQRGIIFVLAIIMLASTVLCFSVFVRAEEKASVVFRIEGRTLVGLLNKTNKTRNRTK